RDSRSATRPSCARPRTAGRSRLHLLRQWPRTPGLPLFPSLKETGVIKKCKRYLRHAENWRPWALLGTPTYARCIWLEANRLRKVDEETASRRRSTTSRASPAYQRRRSAG